MLLGTSQPRRNKREESTKDWRISRAILREALRRLEETTGMKLHILAIASRAQCKRRLRRHRGNQTSESWRDAKEARIHVRMVSERDEHRRRRTGRTVQLFNHRRRHSPSPRGRMERARKLRSSKKWKSGHWRSVPNHPPYNEQTHLHRIHHVHWNYMEYIWIHMNTREESITATKDGRMTDAAFYCI